MQGLAMNEIDAKKTENLLDKLKKAKSTQEMDTLLANELNQHGSMAEIIGMPDELLENIENEATRLYSEECYDDARIFYQFLATCRPGLQKYWMHLGATGMKLEQYEDALKCYGLATIVDPTDPRPYFFSAYSSSKIDKINEAKLCLNQVIALCKESPEWQELKKQASNFLHQINGKG
jgi:type III secretion system low calcium response chaperone LcrH/SycD